MKYQKLFNYLSQEYGALPLESEMMEIVSICREIDEVKSNWFERLKRKLSLTNKKRNA